MQNAKCKMKNAPERKEQANPVFTLQSPLCLSYDSPVTPTPSHHVFCFECCRAGRFRRWDRDTQSSAASRGDIANSCGEGRQLRRSLEPGGLVGEETHPHSSA